MCYGMDVLWQLLVSCLVFSCRQKLGNIWGLWKMTAWHRGSVRASHPSVPSSDLVTTGKIEPDYFSKNLPFWLLFSVSALAEKRIKKKVAMNVPMTFSLCWTMDNLKSGMNGLLSHLLKQLTKICRARWSTDSMKTFYKWYSACKNLKKYPIMWCWNLF